MSFVDTSKQHAVRPSPVPPPGACASFRAESGLRAPSSPLTDWLRDPHLLLALFAAVPVWTLLATGAAGALRTPVGPGGWLSLLLLQPLLEELVFRGILQGQALRQLAAGAQRHIGPLSWANVLVTALFVALHVPAQPGAWALAVAAPSLVFGHLRERFDSVAPAMLAHVVYNAGFALAALAMRAA